MNIQTKYHGEIKVNEQEIWHFEKGLPGFPDEKQFVLLPLPNNDVFMILQAVQTPYIAFVITNPFLTFKDYEFKIDDSTLEQLKLESEKDVAVYSILTVKDPFVDTTINLQAPLIFNVKNHQAKQMILNDSPYHTKHLLFQHAQEPVKE
ncbi:flagellar assembly protein FliW [Heyndrickxia ginsengihumi]|uniref:Flagellar assembly factor FliW n=1 Tax=Heyndrickxia ginsengihumi TaxID=363870 RepID=A0A0A6VIG2_9BACI|nr:flagellar assembly protein FliW [Heyndrickxia ginsengihumi]KHD86419.1 flagellar assembly protein FliW [Heyndrickxia ginsengihumi]